MKNVGAGYVLIRFDRESTNTSCVCKYPCVAANANDSGTGDKKPVA